MEAVIEPKKSRTRRSKQNNLYNNIISTKKIIIPMSNIGINLKANMLKLIENEISGKCNDDGYIKPDSIQLISHSNGIVEKDYVKFEVVFECLVCNPVKGKIINCVAKNITKAGIRAEVNDENNPLIIFIARDHNYLNKSFSNIKENEEITVRVIGQRFELNDKDISIIADLVDIKKKNTKLVINEELIDSELEVGDLSDT